MARIEKGEVMEQIVMARKKQIPYCSSHRSPRKKPVKLVSANFQYSLTFLGQKNQKSLEGKYKEQPKMAIDGMKHTVRTTDNSILHRKLLSAPIKLQKSPKKDVPPKKIQLREPGGKICERLRKSTETEGKHNFQIKTVGPKSRVRRRRQ